MVVVERLGWAIEPNVGVEFCSWHIDKWRRLPWMLNSWFSAKKNQFCLPSKVPQARKVHPCQWLPPPPSFSQIVWPYQSPLISFLPSHPPSPLDLNPGWKILLVGEARTPGKPRFTFPEEGLNNDSMICALFLSPVLTLRSIICCSEQAEQGLNEQEEASEWIQMETQVTEGVLLSLEETFPGRLWKMNHSRAKQDLMPPSKPSQNFRSYCE